MSAVPSSRLQAGAPAVARAGAAVGVIPEASQRWFNLAGAWAAWQFDAVAAGLFAFALPQIARDFQVPLATAAGVVSAYLLATGLGGLVLGRLGDRIGRKNVILLSLMAFGVFNGLVGYVHTLWLVGLLRAAVGFTVGGLWSAAASLVSETWPSRHRATAVAAMQTGWSAGSLLAALFAFTLLPRLGWQGLFATAAMPALAVMLYTTFFVTESPLWLRQRLEGGASGNGSSWTQVFAPAHRRTTVLGLLVSACGMYGFWILTTFLPSYLDATLNVGMARSATFLVWLGVGGITGYLSFGLLADRFGRRRTFLGFFLGMALMVPLYTWLVSRWGVTFLAPATFALGYFTGYFSGYGAWFAELFPTSLRSTASGFCFNGGRAVAAVGPIVVARLVPLVGFNLAIGTAAVGYALAALVVLGLRETRGQELGLD